MTFIFPKSMYLYDYRYDFVWINTTTDLYTIPRTYQPYIYKVRVKTPFCVILATMCIIYWYYIFVWKMCFVMYMPYTTKINILYLYLIRYFRNLEGYRYRTLVFVNWKPAKQHNHGKINLSSIRLQNLPVMHFKFCLSRNDNCKV